MNWQDLVVSSAQTSSILGVPYLSENPEAYQTALAFDAYEILLGLRNQNQNIQEQLKNSKLMRLTRERLKIFLSANEEHEKIMAHLCKSLRYERISFTEFNQYMANKRGGHILTQHYEHLFRDWGWGENENNMTADLAMKVGSSLGQARTVLALGAGACRFPYEMHRRLKSEYTLCVDINPFLLSCAQKIIAGETLELYEFPVIPRDIESFVFKSQLKVSEAQKQGIEFLTHDIEEWAFADESFDVVLTPWFIDVVPIETNRLFALINRVLKKGGHWLNLGPLGFNKRGLANYYSLEETLHLVQKSEFEIVAKEYEAIPYFQHPRAGHWRTEHVLAFLAVKTGNCELPEARQNTELPEWIEDLSKPIGNIIVKEQLRQSFKFGLAVLEKLQAGATVNDVAISIARDFGIAEEHAIYLVSSTLMQWQQMGQYNPMKSKP